MMILIRTWVYLLLLNKEIVSLSLAGEAFLDPHPLHSRIKRDNAYSVLNARGQISALKPDGKAGDKYDPNAKSSCTVPKVRNTVTLDKVKTIATGETFDCELDLYERESKECDLKVEKNHEADVFVLEEGATLKNCHLGFSQESTSDSRTSWF